jgi:hypothetical protein
LWPLYYLYFYLLSYLGLILAYNLLLLSSL